MTPTRACLFAATVLGSAALSHAGRLADQAIRFAERATIPVPAPVSPTSAGDSSRDGSDMMVFFNGDRLHGSLAAFTSATNGLKWTRDDVENPMAFKSADVACVTLGGKGLRSGEQQTATVYLSNKDVFGCNLVSIDGTSVVVEAGAMGRMTLNRSMVTSVALRGGAGSLVYEGPNEASEWTFSNPDSPGNRVDAGTLYIGGGTAEKRLSGYPEVAEVRFSVSWRYYPSLSVLVLGDISGGSFSSGYYVTIQSSNVSIGKSTRNGGGRQVSSFNVEKLRRGVGSAVVQLLIDQKKKTLTLLLDGDVIGTYTDNADLPKGNSLGFTSSIGRGDATRISAIRVTHWDGRVPASDGASVGEGKEDIVRLRNGDKLTGRLDEVSQGKMAVTTSFASLNIPVQNVELITLATTGRETPRRNRMDVRVMFTQSGCLTGDLGTIEGNVLRCRSESFGAVSIPLDTIRKIEFNIYKERPGKGSDSGADNHGNEVRINLDDI